MAETVALEAMLCGFGQMEAVLLDAVAPIEPLTDGWARMMREKTYGRMLRQRPS